MFGDVIYIDESKRYFASVGVVVDGSYYSNPKVEKNLDGFIVSPVIRKNMFGQDAIIGYAESVSKKIVADYVYVKDYEGFTERYICDHKEGTAVGPHPLIRGIIDHKPRRERIYADGDLFWEIRDSYDVTMVLTEEEIRNYYNQVNDFVTLKLNKLRKKANELIVEKYRNDNQTAISQLKLK